MKMKMKPKAKAKANAKKILTAGMAAVLMLLTVVQPGMANSYGTNVVGMVNVQSPNLCAPNLVGIGVDSNTLNFGTLVAGQSASQTLDLTLDISGFESDCGDVAPETVPISVSPMDWQGSETANTMNKSVTVVSGLPGIIDEYGYNPFPIGITTPVTFTVNLPEDVIPDTYIQTIFITAMY